MKIKTVIVLIFVTLVCTSGFAQEINVFINVRGTTGLETELKNSISTTFSSFEHVKIINDRENCHLYLDCTLVEQEPIRFYGLGICIAYRVKDKLYSRPTSDVAQFGEERMEEVVQKLAKEINKAFLEPLRTPAEQS